MSMSPLLSLIQSDPQASQMFAAGNDSGCRDRLIEIAPKIRVPVSAADIKYHAVISGSWAKIKLAIVSSTAPDEIKAACISFVDWVDSGRPIDFDLSIVQQMLGGLVQAGLVDQSTADIMDELQTVAPQITIDEVSALRGQ
jgi:hypothetical protein